MHGPQQRSLKVHCDLIIEIDLPEPWWFNGLFFLVPMDSVRLEVLQLSSATAQGAGKQPGGHFQVARPEQGPNTE